MQESRWWKVLDTLLKIVVLIGVGLLDLLIGALVILIAVLLIEWWREDRKC